MKKILIFSIVLISACNSKTEKIDKINFYNISCSRNRDYCDTFPQNTKTIEELNDTIIGEASFVYNGKGYMILMFTTKYPVPDGGYIHYWLSDFGIIYTKSTTWFSYT